MIRINLLPVRQTRKAEAARLEFLLALFGGAVVLGLCGLGWGVVEFQLSSVREENRLLQVEIDRLAADVAKVDEMEKFKAELERKLNVIEDLRTKKSGPVHMLDEIALATPDKLYLNKLDEKNGEVSIRGVSVSNDVISQFLRALDDSPYFEQVFLQDIEALPPEKNMSVTLKQFKLSARIVTPKAAGAKDAKDGGDTKGAGDAKEGAAPAAPGGGA